MVFKLFEGFLLFVGSSYLDGLAEAPDGPILHW